MPSWLSKLGKHERERTEGTRSPSPGHSSSGSRSRALSSASTRSSGGNHPRAKSEGSASAREAFEELGVLNLKNSKKLPPREPTPEPPRVEVDFVSQDDASSGLDVTVVPPSPAGPGSDDASLPPDNDDNNSEKEGSGEGKRFNVPPDILTDGGTEEAEEILTAKPASLHSKQSQPKMRRQISETSINTNVPIITTNAGHGRYATTGSTFTGSPTDGNIVESPTGDIPPNHEQIPSDNTITSANASPPQPKPTKKGSSWRPSSKQRKPTGLAAAIAGSSLAMVNATGGSVIVCIHFYRHFYFTHS
ncbi:hypothetical protein DL96DRAFT_110531 [Flagelloscypha sp. PMI_526]|nr:hypothetical protein DL96DRAFT_110531 [Flagelloscypha sp. PMI_526]